MQAVKHMSAILVGDGHCQNNPSCICQALNHDVAAIRKTIYKRQN